MGDEIGMKRISEGRWPSFEGARAGTSQGLGVLRQAQGQQSRLQIPLSASIDHRIVIVTVST
jgi:hypothetical protein